MAAAKTAARSSAADPEADPDPASWRMPAAVRIMAITAAATVANLYYNQPMLELIGRDLRIRAADLGLVPAATLLGYASGLLFLVPLGDRVDRRRLVLVQLVGVIVALLAAAASPDLPMLLGASLIVGLCSTAAQQLVPFAASLAPPAVRGRVVGIVVGAIMIGILMARTVGGVLSQFAGWRLVFVAAALAMCGSLALVRGCLPSSTPTTALSYGRLLGSLVPLVRRHATLREAMGSQMLLFGAFNACGFGR
jgi:predicted MFS family arabinose efflux permease